MYVVFVLIFGIDSRLFIDRREIDSDEKKAEDVFNTVVVLVNVRFHFFFIRVLKLRVKLYNNIILLTCNRIFHASHQFNNFSYQYLSTHFGQMITLS